jgi:hypothetical protein
MVQRTIMVPETFMTTQSVTVQKPVGVVQNRQRTIQKVIEGQKIIDSQQILQYERPRVQVIPGRMLGAEQPGVQQVGVQWNRAYYDQSSAVDASDVAVDQVAFNPTQYQTISAPIGVQQVAGHYVGSGAGGQFIGGGGQVPGGGGQFVGVGGQQFASSSSPAPGPYGQPAAY